MTRFATACIRLFLSDVGQLSGLPLSLGRHGGLPLRGLDPIKLFSVVVENLLLCRIA